MVEVYLSAVANVASLTNGHALILRSVRASLKRARLTGYRRHLVIKHR